MRSQKGQVLLITVMLLATTLSVVLSLSFRSVTETKLTKMEEENEKAIAAAESAIEKALKDSSLVDTMTFSELGLTDLNGINSALSGVSIDTTLYNYFVTPLLLKDEQYVYYLDSYDPVENTFAGSSYTNPLTFYIQSPESAGNLAVELTYLSGSTTNPTITRHIIDPHGIITVGSGGKAAEVADSSGTLGGVSFSHKTNAAITTPANAKLLIIRVFNNQTRVGIAGASLKPQGRTIISEARATSGSTKRIRFFQSYPQIPAEFFVTSF